MIQVKRMSHATFVTPDIERQIDYFTNIAGLALAERENGRAYLATKVGDLAVQLEKGDQAQCAKIAFQIAPETDFDDIRRGLEAEGVRCQPRNDAIPGVPKMLAFEDPKGTMIEVFAEQNPIAKNQQVAGIGPLKLGHIAFHCPDVKAVADFYAKVMGFRVSDWIEDWFVFMRCNTDHHTVNFIIGDKPELHHIAFEVENVPLLHKACDFLARNKIQLVWGPGRHIVGHNVAAYHRSPDYIRVEMFCEMDLMKDEALGYWEPRPWHEEMPLRPKHWPEDTWRSAWGFGSFGTFPGYP